MNHSVMANWLASLIGRKPVEAPFLVNGLQCIEIALSKSRTQAVTLVGPFKGLDVEGLVVDREILSIIFSRDHVTIMFQGGGRVIATFAKEQR